MIWWGAERAPRPPSARRTRPPRPRRHCRMNSAAPPAPQTLQRPPAAAPRRASAARPSAWPAARSPARAQAGAGTTVSIHLVQGAASADFNLWSEGPCTQCPSQHIPTPRLCAQWPAPRTTMATAAAPNGTPASSAACTMRPSARCRSLSASPSAPPAPAPGQPRRACTKLYGNAATSFASCRGAGARSRAAGSKVVTQHMV